VARARLERVRERVPEVEHLSLAEIVRIAEADGGFEGGAAAHELGLGQLPQRLSRQQPRLHHLGQAVLPLPFGQRGEQRGIDQRPGRPVEGADEVLALGQVDSGLASDRGVHLAGQRGRDGNPGDAAQVAGGRIPGGVGERTPAEYHQRPVPA